MHVFVHDEDDVGMLQLLPIEWQAYCEGEFVAAAAHARDHESDDGIGWTRMYALADPDPSLPRLRMTERQFAEALRPECRRFERIESPLAEIDAELGIRSAGFGPSRSCGIIADLDGDTVKSIWCRLDATSAEYRKIVANMLTALTLDQHLLLVDWRDHRVVDLRDRDGIDAYLAR